MAAHPLTEIHDWIGDGPNGSFVLMDPVRDEPVTPDAPPDFMYDSNELWEGHEFLRRGLGGIAVLAYFGKADQNATDLTAVSEHNSLEKLVREAQTVGYAVDGRSDVDEESRIEAASFAWHDLGQKPDPTGNGYLDRLTAAIVDADVISYNAGIEPASNDATRQGPVVEHTLQVMAAALTELREAPGIDPAVAAMHEIAYNNLVDWYNTMMIGYRIGQIAAAAQAENNTLQSSLVVLPAKKIDVVRKLAVSNAPHVDKVFADPAHYDPGLVRDERIMRFGRLD